MPSALIPTSPDLLTPWRSDILSVLPGVDVGVKRPADVENLNRPFVRLVQLGGPWSFAHSVWEPRVLTEVFAPSAQEAHRIDATVARVTASLAGSGGKPGQPPGWYITASDLESQGAQSTIDGQPVVVTTAYLCVQVWPTVTEG